MWIYGAPFRPLQEISAHSKDTESHRTGGGPPPPGLTPAEDLALALNKTRPVTKGLESGVDTHIPQVQPGVLQQVVVAEDGILHLAESYFAPVSGFEFVAVKKKSVISRI